MGYGKNAKESRIKAGFTVQDLARKAQISEQTIRFFEREDRSTHFINVVLCADALGMSIDEYVGHTVISEDDE